MAQLVLENKAESLRRCIVRVETKCPPTLQELEADMDAQDVVVLNLSRAVQLCVDMAMHRLNIENAPTPQTMGESFEALAKLGVIDTALCTRLRGAVGFRNLAVHNYNNISWAVVFTIAKNHLDDFRAFARAMIPTV
jgi:uncharacterized protein YutE (UPF0331/DUF86 family)